MKAFQENLKSLEATDTQVLGVSVDSPPSNAEWAKQNGISYPLLSDWAGENAKKYGIFLDDYKAARRATFLIDKSGKVEEVQLDKTALDPKNIVTACERHKLKQ